MSEADYKTISVWYSVDLTALDFDKHIEDMTTKRQEFESKVIDHIKKGYIPIGDKKHDISLNGGFDGKPITHDEYWNQTMYRPMLEDK